MRLSPRIRPDYLLLYPAPSAQQCLEAFATEQGVEFCRPYPNIIAKAATKFPRLPELMAMNLPPDLVAGGVCAALDGLLMDMQELPLPNDFLDG